MKGIAEIKRSIFWCQTKSYLEEIKSAFASFQSIEITKEPLVILTFAYNENDALFRSWVDTNTHKHKIIKLLNRVNKS